MRKIRLTPNRISTLIKTCGILLLFTSVYAGVNLYQNNFKTSNSYNLADVEGKDYGTGMMDMSQTPSNDLLSGNTVSNEDAGIVESTLTVTLSPAMDVCILPGGVPNPIIAIASGGMAPYAYLWSTGQTTFSIAPTPSITTTYSVIVTDNAGCSIEKSITLILCSSIGNKVFYDGNQNGQQDVNEPGVPGVLTYLLDKDMNRIPDPMNPGIEWSITTDMNGIYIFDDIVIDLIDPTGDTFFVEFVIDESAGNLLSPIQNPDVNSGMAMDTDTDSDVDATPFGDGFKSGEIVLLINMVLNNIDAGIIGNDTIGNFVFEDSNGNGLQEMGEPGIPGVEVYLKINGIYVDTTMTAMDGTYQFADLIPNPAFEYSIQFEAPMGYYPTLVNAGGDDELDSDADTAMMNMSVGVTFIMPDSNNMSIDAGFIEPVSIGDTAWVDTNGNGLQDMGEDGLEDVTVTIYRVNPMTMVGEVVIADLDGVPVIPMLTAADGSYKFTNLPPGQYYTEFDVSTALNGPDYFITFENINGIVGDLIDSDINMLGISDTVMVLSDTMDCSLDAGYFLPVSVGDLVFLDDNGDGLQDIIEPGISDVIVRLFKLDGMGMGIRVYNDYLGNELDSLTAMDGSYKFDSLPPGRYYVEFDPNNTVNGTNLYPTYDHIGVDSMLDSDIPDMMAFGSDTTVYLLSDSMDCALDAGFFSPISVGDTAFIDANLNGLQDPLEVGLPGVIVTLYYYNPDTMDYVEVMSDLDGNLIDPDTTDATGRYKFENLPPGEYFVIFDAGGIPTTTQDVGMDDNIDSDIDEMGFSDTLIVLSTDTMNCSFDAGYIGIDYGDLPDTYVTADSSNMNMAPKHIIRENKFLGAKIDQDLDAAPSINGNGDDSTSSSYIAPFGQTGPDDEDGIEFLSPLIPGYPAYIKITYTAELVDTAYLNAWIDWNGDGMFGVGENVMFTEVDTNPITPTDNLGLEDGTNIMISATFDVPPGAMFIGGKAHARFRMSCAGSLAADNGLALDGEIEDYVVPLAKVGNLSWYDDNLNGRQDTSEMTVPTEGGVESTKIYLTYAGFNSTDLSMDTIVYETETDANGVYTFCGLIEGKYDLVAAKYVDNVATPEDTIPVRYILTIGNNTNQITEDDLDSDFTPRFMFDIPDLFNNNLVVGEDGDQDTSTMLNGFPDIATDLTYDMGWIPEPNIEAILSISGVQVPASDQCGNFNVILDLCIKNTGFIEKEDVLVGAALENISAIIDLDSLLGGAFVGIVGTPVVLTELEYDEDLLENTPSMDSLPTADTNYDGNNNTNTLEIDGTLLPDEEICIRVIAEIAPGNIDMMDALALAFSAEVMAEAVNSQGQAIPDYFNGGNQYIAVDTSDMEFEFDGTYNDPNTPTPLGDCWKTIEDLLEIAMKNISVDEGCQLMLDASQFLSNLMPECHKDEYPLGGYYVIDVQLAGPGNHPDLPINDQAMVMLDAVGLIGDSLKISVSSVADHCNSVWGIAHVQDKLPPVITCVSDTISCIAAMDAPIKPKVDDNCGFTIELVDEYPVSIECDSFVIGKLVRTWIATDLGGNKDTCVQDVFLRRFPVDSVQFPGDKLLTSLECNSGYLELNGAPHPSVTGTPTLNGNSLFQFNSSIACNGYVEYSDKIENMGCITRVTRRWRIGEWWCSTVVKKEFVQVINIEDTKAPTIISMPGDMTISTGSRSCTGIVTLPPITWTDQCGTPASVQIFIENAMMINGNGGSISLEAGVHNVNYILTDDCNNSTEKSLKITVVDGKSPVVICLTNTTVSLNNHGFASMDAKDFDNGSFDECTDVTYMVRRMDTTCNPDADEFGPSVEFCCTDAGKEVMVALKVTDEGGNTNVCMVTVEVQEKIDGRMVCLLDQQAECTENFDLDNLTDRFGFPAFNDNCPNNGDITESVEDFRNQCGIGNIVRTFVLKNVSGQVIQTCIQTIEIEGDINLNEDDIEWPKDFFADNLCSTDDLAPENLPDSSAMPKLPEGMCNLTSIKHFDELLEGTVNGNACFTILRTWKVIDWCQRTGSPTSNEFPTYEHEQIIKIGNTIDPSILTDCRDTIIESVDNDCGSAFLALSLEAEDDCTPQAELIVTYRIELEDNTMQSGSGSMVSGSFPVGTHRIFWKVLDKCGNEASCDYAITVKNVKAPTAICFDDLSTSLVPMDTDDLDTEPDTAMAMIEAKLFNGGSTHPCGFDLKYSFSADVDDTLKVFGCPDVGEQDIQLWVTDSEGNQSFCETSILITLDSSGGFCIPIATSQLVDIAGIVATSNQDEVEGVEITLIGAELPLQTTGRDGEYAFNEMPKGGNYIISPIKDNDPLNGVSTLDLVLIQRHILGLSAFTSPYVRIAADINASGGISAADIIELRKVILGHYTGFNNNTSWTFVDADYSFSDPENPWDDETPQNYSIYDLVEDMNVNFKAIKIGDVSGDVIANSKQRNISTRSDEKWMLSITDQYVEKGDILTISARGDYSALEGIQLELSSTGIDFVDIFGHEIEINNSNFYLDKDVVRLSISALPDNNLVTEEVSELFTIKMRVKQSGRLKDLLQVSDQHFYSEVYTKGSLSAQEIGIDWNKETYGSLILHQNTPNPWLDNTSISFTIPQDGAVTLVIRDVAGRLLKKVTDNYHAGKNKVSFQGSDIPASGVMIYEIQYADQLLNRRMIRVK